ncbi:hypothetical protein RB25_05535 [Herbaspirillum rubrisubalbicans]|nr:hypothetical protein RB25_05535 [Herbaspirillum rubrisubalbicans]
MEGSFLGIWKSMTLSVSGGGDNGKALLLYQKSAGLQTCACAVKVPLFPLCMADLVGIMRHTAALAHACAH